MKKYALMVFFAILVSFSFYPVIGESDGTSIQEKENKFQDVVITWIDRCVIQGHTSAVRIIDHSMNKDPEKIEQFEIEVWSDSETKIVTPYATETGPDTGMFEVTVFFFTTDEGSSHRVQAFTGDTVFARYVVNSTIQNSANNDNFISAIPIVAKVPVLENTKYGKFSEILYGPCTISYFERFKDTLPATQNYEMLFSAPLKQIRSGLYADEVVCKDPLLLVARNGDSPACVKPETIPELVTRGWGTSSDWFKISNFKQAINYEIENAKIRNIDAFSEYKNRSLPEETKNTWLQITLDTAQDGFLKITLPRHLIDSKIDDTDYDFFVLLDGTETEYEETKTNSERILGLHFPAGIDIIEIVGHGFYNSELPPFNSNSGPIKIQVCRNEYDPSWCGSDDDKNTTSDMQQHRQTKQQDTNTSFNSEEILVPQNIRERLEAHPTYLALKERYHDSYSMIRYANDVGYLLIAGYSSDGNSEYTSSIRLHVTQDEFNEKKYTTRIICNTDPLGLDYLRDTDEGIVDYIKNTDCLEIKTDPDIVYHASSPMTEDEMKDLMKSHPVYLAMKERFPDAIEESETFNTGRIEMRVDAINPENGNKLALTLASSNRIERVDAYAQCLDTDHILLHQKHSHTLEYISSTDCLEYDLGTGYTHPPDAD